MTVMRVDLQTQQLETLQKAKAGRTAQPSPPKAEDEAAVDRASFSFDQVRVQSLASEVMAQPEVRDQRVEALRQAVGKGEYAVSDGQIAEAMMSDLRGGKG